MTSASPPEVHRDENAITKTARTLIGLAALYPLLSGCSSEQAGPPRKTVSQPPTTTAQATSAVDPVAEYFDALRSARQHLTDVEDKELLGWGMAACGTAREKLIEDPDDSLQLIRVEAGLAASEVGAPNNEREFVVNAALGALCTDVVIPG